jgi:hypothetical protein
MEPTISPRIPAPQPEMPDHTAFSAYLAFA